jgi:glycosyltransferase involved in cell wall biosynthesis
MPKPPKVSICIPTYNRIDLFRATLRSVLCQSFTDFEIIVSDNASQEDISRLIQETNDPRIRFYEQSKNLGAAANFFYLQTLPKGEYVLYLCSDDLLLPDCLEKAVRVLDLNPTRGGVVYMSAYYGRNGFECLSTMPSIPYADADIYRENREVREFNFSQPSFCLYRRATFESLGGWDRELLALIDWEMYSRMVRKGGGICYLKEVLGILRMHENRHTDGEALRGDFYHDYLILSLRQEHQSGTFLWLRHYYKARLVMEQVLWDIRLQRCPWATLRHSWRCKALKSFLMLLPYEVVRRFLIKFGPRKIMSKRTSKESEFTPLTNAFDREAVDILWNEMTSQS